MLIDTRRRIEVPSGRVVVMAARVTSNAPIGVGIREFPAIDPGARVPGGRLLPIELDQTDAIEVMAWNTGEASDLKRYGNLTHAERQFVRFMGDMEFTTIEIEISHSPCTACADMLAKWLADSRAKGRIVTKAANRRVGRKIYLGSPMIKDLDIPAVIRWGELFTSPPQATTWQCLSDLRQAGWGLAAPRSELPLGSGPTPVVLL
jgi:hypothetical protein